MSYPYAEPTIIQIDPTSPAVSSAEVLNDNSNALKAMGDSLNAMVTAFYLDWAPSGGLFVSGASPSNLPVAGTGLTVQLIALSKWLINGYALTLGNSNVIIGSIPDNQASYVYVTLDGSGNVVFANASLTPNPQAGLPCIGLVTAAGGVISSIDTTKTDTVPTLPYLLSLANSGGGGGGGSAFDPSALWAAIQTLQAGLAALQNMLTTGSTTAVASPFNILVQETMNTSVNLRKIDPVSGDDSFIVDYAPGISGDDGLRLDGSHASDARGGGDAVDDALAHDVSGA